MYIEHCEIKELHNFFQISVPTMEDIPDLNVNRPYIKACLPGLVRQNKNL